MTTKVYARGTPLLILFCTFSPQHYKPLSFGVHPLRLLGLLLMRKISASSIHGSIFKFAISAVNAHLNLVSSTNQVEKASFDVQPFR